MIFLIECIVACILFTLMVKLATWKKQTAFTNDYPPVVTDKLRTMGLIAEKPPARKQDYIRKAIAMVVFGFLFALVLRYVNGLTGFLPATLTAYALWLVVDWYDFAVVDVLMAPLDKFYQKSGVSAFDPSAVKFHFIHSVYGMVLGLPVAMVAGLMVVLL